MSGDSSEGKRALAELDQALSKAEQSTGDLAREGVKASVAMDRLEVAEREAAAAGIQLSQAQKQAAMQGKDLTVAAHAQSAALKNTTQMTNAQRAGSQQLAMQLGDVATMFSLGARPQQIFASQGMQVVQAIGLMRGSAGGLIGFLGGPWGLGVMAATTALTPFIGRLFDTEDAIKGVEDRAWQAIDALNSLARTDISAQIATAEGQLSRLREREAQQVAKESRAGQNRGGSSIGLAPGEIRRLRNGGEEPLSPALASIRQDILRAENAINQGRRQLREQAEKEEQRKGSSAGGAANRAASTSRGSGAARELERESRNLERYRSEVYRLGQEELQARLALTTDMYEEADLRSEMLAREREERERQIRQSEDLTKAQKEAQIAYLDRLYGEREASADGENITVRPGGLLDKAMQRDLDERQVSMSIDMMARQASALDAQIGITRSLDQRDDLERRALELQHEIERKLLEQDILQGRILDADRARALLAEQQASEREGQRLDQRGPLGQYADGMDMGAGEFRNYGEQLIVEELEHFRSGMREGIMDAIGVDDPLLSGIIDMFIQQVIIAPLAEGLQSAGAGNWLGSLFSSFGGLFGGGRATGGPVSPGKIYAVNERSSSPGLFIPMAPGRIDAGGDNDNTGGASMRGAAPITFDLRGAVVTQDLLDQMNEISRANSRAAVSAYDQGVSERVQDQLARRA